MLSIVKQSDCTGRMLGFLKGGGDLGLYKQKRGGGPGGQALGLMLKRYGLMIQRGGVGVAVVDQPQRLWLYRHGPRSCDPTISGHRRLRPKTKVARG